MNYQKKEWISLINSILSEHYVDDEIKIVFQANEKESIYKIKDKYFIPCDVVFSSKNGLHVFQFFTNKDFQYRFFIKNKFFWEINSKTKEKTNRIAILKLGQKNLNSQNNKYNKFYLMAFNINIEGSGDGIYGVTPKILKILFNYEK